jgi:hypothetical protein
MAILEKSLVFEFHDLAKISAQKTSIALSADAETMITEFKRVIKAVSSPSAMAQSNYLSPALSAISRYSGSKLET